MARTAPIPDAPTQPQSRVHILIAALCLAAIASHLFLRFRTEVDYADAPLWIALGLGGTPLVAALLKDLFKGKFGSDLLGGISIITSIFLHEYLAGTLVVLMLAGGQALESYAVTSASSVLRALSKRVPTVAHAKRDDKVVDVPLESVEPGDMLTVMPHEICPADGVLSEGHGSMDESYLTGEPYQIAKAPGSQVLSGAVNGESAVVIKVTRKPADSRYAKIMQVMKESEQQRPQLRRIGDSLGALYTPVAVGIALLSGLAARDPNRFLAVLVVATPCPLLIAIPVAIIGSISLAARRGIIIKDPAVLEQLPNCRTIFFDKTGTLTYGEPRLAQLVPAAGSQTNQTQEPLLDLAVRMAQHSESLLALAASLAQYSRHPLSRAISLAAEERKIALLPVDGLTEPAGQGISADVCGKRIQITSRKKLEGANAALLPPISPGLECVMLVDGKYVAAFQFRDEPRADVRSFIGHMGPRHAVRKMILLTGDRAPEANHLAQAVGIDTVLAEKSPEEKLAIVKAETLLTKTAYLGDGINDAPSLLAATVGIAFGNASDVTVEAASAVILDASLRKLDEFWHIAVRLRRIALQSAVGGILLSLIALVFAATGHLPPVAGAVVQEVIDVVAVLNALRAALPPRSMSDM